MTDTTTAPVVDIDADAGQYTNGLAFTYEHLTGLTLNDDGRGCPIWYRNADDYEKAFTEAADPMSRYDWQNMRPKPRTWHIPHLPTPEVRALRDCHGHLWLRGQTAGLTENDLWECQREGFPAGLHTWYQLLEYAPLTDATGELLIGA